MRMIAAAIAACGLWTATACAQPAPSQNATSFMAQNALAEGVKTLPSGVQYKIVKSGAPNGQHPTPEDMVKVNYEGTLLNGQVFDSSIKRGKPVTFQLKNLIPGWIDAVQQMRPGDEWIVWVPPALGYGDEQSGPIPPNSVLVFKLDLLAIGDQAGSPD